MNKIVEVQNVTKVYGKNNEKKTQALSGISFDVEKANLLGSWALLVLVNRHF